MKHKNRHFHMLPICQPVISDTSVIDALIKSGQLSTGAMVMEFEHKIARFLNVEDSVAVSNGTSALFISLLLASVKTGDEVILPDFTFPAAANCVEWLGGVPVPVDIDPETFNLRYDSALKAITKKTKAMVVVHEFGIPLILDEIMAPLKDRGITLIEDAACALGGKIGNSYLGAIGDLGCFSFHPRKILTTAEGGCIISNDRNILKLARIIRNQGKGGTDPIKPFTFAGLNFRMSDVHSAIGLSQLDGLENNIKSRKQIVDYYIAALDSSSIIHVPECYLKNTDAAFQSFTVMCQDSVNRNLLIVHLKNSGIESVPGGYSLHLQPYYSSKYNYDPSLFENSRLASERSLSLPLFPAMTREDVYRVADAIERFKE